MSCMCFYDIYEFNTNKIIHFYCDLTSEPGSAWTLVMSYALKNKLTNSLQSRTFQQNVPINERSPNWDIYRMSNSQMNYMKSQSTHWRVTCSYPKNKVDYIDYVRSKFSDLDVMTFSGSDISIIESSVSGCQFDARIGSVYSEDNFGYYGVFNNKFRCTENQVSTTNWWFGAYK
ncbi:uncharacterized protein LOC124438471 [Xenia sp. Carnegie-2017]|uniref:uncharacterized protein LOC124438471 n=1 Tax=Xenia sp. Carnegie-2017 TaxID=2897299 RepID=UPI001F040730|nr:uncharacterized protein LOC124438471 [Xenia sp. Carnegie-2017]